MNKENENISFFLEAAEKYGVPRHNLFQTVDLAEGQNLAQVQTGLYNVRIDIFHLAVIQSPLEITNKKIML